jgi:Ala-tRNA(Pro) deacylase
MLMSISATVRHYLDASQTPYDLVPHSRAFTSMETAEAAHVPGDALAKSVLVKGHGRYALVLLPATHQVRLDALRERFGQAFSLAQEHEIRSLFKDCETGSIPPFGDVYGIDVIVDDALLRLDDVYFEAGDHEELVHVSGEDFGKLLTKAKHGHFGDRT